MVGYGWFCLHCDSYIAYKGAKDNLIMGAILLLVPALHAIRETRRK